MQDISFAVKQGLQPGDVVIVPKSEWNIVAHYVVYWGVDHCGTHYYFENNHIEGVRSITEYQFASENPTFLRLRLFRGNDYERSLAVSRALSLWRNKYDLEKFNCENYANYVQFGHSYSKQVQTVKQVAVAAGILALIGLFLLELILFSAL